jgi:hypothetical protein
MGLSDWASIASIGMFLLCAISFLIDRGPQMFKWGKPYWPKIGLFFMVLAVISAGISLYASRYVPPPLQNIQQKVGPSTKQIEQLVEKTIQKHVKEVQAEASQGRFVLPHLGEEAVPDISIGPRPILTFTDKEIRRIYNLSPHIIQEILDNQVEWKAYADKADIAIEGYRNYIRTIFGGGGKAK